MGGTALGRYRMRDSNPSWPQLQPPGSLTLQRPGILRVLEAPFIVRLSHYEYLYDMVKRVC